MKPHFYGCDCKQCHNMILAIIAQDANGEYFFTDEELLALSMSSDEHAPRVAEKNSIHLETNHLRKLT